MGLKELHPCWPEFERESKYHICMYQIDGKGSLPFYGNKSLTHAHLLNGNLGRYWRSLHDVSVAFETGESLKEKDAPINKEGAWCLIVREHRIKLTVEYIDPQAPPIEIDDKTVENETKDGKHPFSQQTRDFLDFLLKKLE